MMARFTTDDAALLQRAWMALMNRHLFEHGQRRGYVTSISTTPLEGTFKITMQDMGK